MDEKKLICTTEQFQKLLDLLSSDGYRLLGPTVRNEVIICDEIHSAKDLPIGWMDEQDPGYYRLKRRADDAYFGYNLGPHSWKQFLFPPHEKLVSAAKKEQTLQVARKDDPSIQKMAFIGVHPCELQAIAVQDKVFHHSIDVYRQYQLRRDTLFIVAVNCTRSVNTCFCASMGTGPDVKEGFDIALTEVIEGKDHYFLVDIGSEKGRVLCAQLFLSLATPKDCERGQSMIQANKEKMIRSVDNQHVHDLLMNSWGYKRWDQVAGRCLNCTNCTMVCPTCFCSEHQERACVDGAHSNRWQSWDSCFNLSHSFIHGGPVRQSARSRYRQWLTHKFGSWWDQFGMSGCVGCGRCITWCPVGIDVTEELHELQIESKNK